MLRRVALPTAIASLLVPLTASAVDLPRVAGKPVKLDITETSIVVQRFNPRDNERDEDQGFFAWLNRLNAVLGWNHFTLGIRLDSSLYAFRPEDRSGPLERITPEPGETPEMLAARRQARRSALQVDGASRYRDAIYPAKLWLTYKNDGLEVTAGDNYVQFGRGLVLSMRKVDELGVDTTLFGGKVTFQKDPIAVTLIAGVANPSRIDEPSGRALFLPRATPTLPAQPLFGSDRMVGAQIQAGRGGPIIASTHAVRLTRCAPFRYDASSQVVDGVFDAPFGTCDEPHKDIWLNTLPTGLGPVLASPEVINAGQSLEVPSLWGHGNIYLEGAVQKRQGETPQTADTQGNALYATVVTTGGPITNTLEIKSYRNFYPLAGAVNVSRASAFANVQYSVPPTAEPIISDVMFGFYNACVNGARDRFDYRFTPTFLGYGTFGYAVSKSEEFGGQCDKLGRSTADRPAETTNTITDAGGGVEWRFDNDRSILFANVNGRHDILESGSAFYREISAQYSLTKYIGGAYAIEIAGRHRYRAQKNENLSPDASDLTGQPWWQGENQLALKVAPKWVVSGGYEYTTFEGLPTNYFNGTILYRFTTESNVRIYVGQNRQGLRCVSGICRVFPAFSGARIELTLRF